MNCSRCGCSDPNPTCDVCCEPFSDGEAAYYAGQPKDGNPFTGQAAEDWESGWEFGEQCAKSDPCVFLTK